MYFFLRAIAIEPVSINCGCNLLTVGESAVGGSTPLTNRPTRSLSGVEVRIARSGKLVFDNKSSRIILVNRFGFFVSALMIVFLEYLHLPAFSLTHSFRKRQKDFIVGF